MSQGFVNGTAPVLPDKICQGRLTLTSGVPVTISDVLAATTLYFTSYQGNQIDLYTGSTWQRFSFSELSIAIPATTGTLYDVFVYNNSGTPTLELTAWTNTSTRATALTTQDGVYVKTGVTTRRYVGTFSTTTASGQCEDSFASRLCWNYYNRCARPMKNTTETTNNWNYSSSTFQQANANSANQLYMIIGVQEDMVEASVGVMAMGNNTNTIPCVGIGINSTTVSSAQRMVGFYQSVASVGKQNASAFYKGFPALGQVLLTWLECNASNANTVTWYGDDGSPGNEQAGIQGVLWG